MDDPRPDDWRIEALSEAHDATAFRCGKPSLDTFIRRYALRNQQNDIGRTFVGLRPASTRVYGYYTVASGKVIHENLPEEERRLLPRYPVPVVLIGKLAVDLDAQGRRLGVFLPMDALRLSVEASRLIGVHGVEVEALDEQAKSFYEKYGFTPLKDDHLHLYLPLEAVRKLGLR